MSSKDGGRLPSLSARMRARRLQLGLTGIEVALRASISPSYVSLIEKGAKIPDEEVAVALARALADDEDLYRAWARTARLGLDKLELVNRLEVMSRSAAYVSLVESGQADLTPRLREVAWRLDPFPPAAPKASPSAPAVAAVVESGVVRVPVLAEGEDPDPHGGGAKPPASADDLLVDGRLVAGSDPRLLFAYEIGPGAMTHLRGLAGAGDRIVLERGGALGPDRICAVRTPRGIVLARVLLKGTSLLLLPGEGQSDFETLNVPDARKPQELVAGTHVLLLRR